MADNFINPATGRLNKKSTPVKIVNKGATLLPSRRAVKTLMKGNPSQRSFNNYAKLTPSGRNAPPSYQDILDMAETGGVNLRKP